MNISILRHLVGKGCRQGGGQVTCWCGNSDVMCVKGDVRAWGEGARCAKDYVQQQEKYVLGGFGDAKGCVESEIGHGLHTFWLMGWYVVCKP